MKTTFERVQSPIFLLLREIDSAEVDIMVFVKKNQTVNQFPVFFKKTIYPPRTLKLQGFSFLGKEKIVRAKIFHKPSGFFIQREDGVEESIFPESDFCEFFAKGSREWKEEKK